MVGQDGVEPSIATLSEWCVHHYAIGRGGPARTRTAIGRVQTGCTPVCATSPNVTGRVQVARAVVCALPFELSARVVGRPGLEPGTLHVSDACTPMLSGHASSQLVDPAGLEPATSTMPLWRAPDCATGPDWYPRQVLPLHVPLCESGAILLRHEGKGMETVAYNSLVRWPCGLPLRDSTGT
jgi:hypothetical protein